MNQPMYGAVPPIAQIHRSRSQEADERMGIHPFSSDILEGMLSSLPYALLAYQSRFQMRNDSSRKYSYSIELEIYNFS